MGSYLSEPTTEKVSSDESSDKLICGASSMQGWRISQEDAHNCLLDFDVNSSLFAVYDGHGGHEVALYTAQKFPDFLKSLETYKNGEMGKALIEAFLGFDKTISTREVVAILKELAGHKIDDEESDEENVNHLYEEANMPIELVIEKYTSNLINPHLKNLQKDNIKQPSSPTLKAKKSDAGSSGSSKVTAECSSSCNDDIPSASNVLDGVSSSSNVQAEAISSNSDKKEETCEIPEKVAANGPTEKPEIKVQAPDSSEDSKEVCTPSNTTEDINTNNHTIQNGEVAPSEDSKVENVTTTTQENGDISPKKGKGKALAKTKGVKTPNIRLRPKRTAQQLYSKILDFDEESDEEDDEDKTFEGPNERSSEDEDMAEEEEDNSEDSSEEDEEDEEDEEEYNEADMEFARNMKEEPGSDSGCTAVVALLKGNELYVANAGDSRCVVCRNGKAVEMSFDHKPEDDPERERVVKAGGVVTMDGRINGGLNLSRAIGDHAYKQNKDLSDQEQMITALPDIRTLTINPAEDEFMVLACDGIWNYMSSQEVVDFVRPMIGCEKLSQICEEMFDHCLAPNTMGDGTGCDNMTAIIVRFKSDILKRHASVEADNEETPKRAKTEESVVEQAA